MKYSYWHQQLPCPNTEICCKCMKQVSDSIKECKEQDMGCDIYQLKLCERHINKISYLFKKHEYEYC